MLRRLHEFDLAILSKWCAVLEVNGLGLLYCCPSILCIGIGPSFGKNVHLVVQVVVWSGVLLCLKRGR